MSVLVFTENWDGKFKKLSYELVSYAAEIAGNTGGNVICLSIGDVEENLLQELGNYGAAKVISVSDKNLVTVDNKAYATVIAQVVNKENPSVLVFANNSLGKALAPRLSVKLKAGLVSGVTEIPSCYEPFTVKKSVYSGKSFSNIIIKSSVKIITLAQNSFEIKETDNKVVIEHFSADLSAVEIKTVVKDVQKVTGQVLLTDAEIVISGGRGMKGPEFWDPIEKLAELMGAATACSRPVSDEGWRPHHEHTGQTGKIIAPNLYIACGISGAIQHLAGVSSSKCLVAINKDNEAPIFEAADYGIIGDIHQVLPELIEAYIEFKSNN